MSSVFEEIQKQLSDLFGTYRAEWLQEQVFDLFTEPRYFPELTTRQSCVLVGGRGTGKTTVLRSLSYAGQHALALHRSTGRVKVAPFIGLYHRINTNHVTAFRGAGLSDEEWTRPFAHYFNLLLCELLVEFIEWERQYSGHVIPIDPVLLARVCRSLHLKPVEVVEDFHSQLIDSRLQFESEINNIADSERLTLSLQQRPVELLCSAILACEGFRERHFFFLLDEYENLLPYQQQIVNTFIKHTSGQYYFKIGVKELGWVCRTTLQANEQLISPADYALVRISDRMKDEAFLLFAKEVCEMRLRQVKVNGTAINANLNDALPALSVDEEADLLGVNAAAENVIRSCDGILDSDDIGILRQLTPLEVFFLDQWAKSHDTTLQHAVAEFRDDEKAWRQRFENYKYSSLFAIRTRKRGIDKYYCGLDVYSQLACGNIRYMLELVDHAFLAHIRDNEDPLKPISPETQTKAAQHVGAMNLSELEGLSVSGARLTKLLLALGRVFQQFAAEPFGHAPELNQFHLTSVSDEVEELLRHAVMHLALVRFPGTKLGTASDTLAFDYTIHPIFAAMFEFSPRRKRKMEIPGETIAELVENPKVAINSLLKKHNRNTGLAVDLPRQLTLFSQFFENEK